MASVRSILLRVEVRPAGRKCNCARNKKHVILMGEPRVAVRAPGVATPEKGYCAECGAMMLKAAQERLSELGSQLGE